ncbi:MAG: S8 family peptidase [bacterium]|nr:S8 family peptidase [bacterium]
MPNCLSVDRELLNKLIYGAAIDRRHTQDTAVMPDVWFALGEEPDGEIDLLLTPLRGSSPGKVHDALRAAVGAGRRRPRGSARPRNPMLAYNESNVAIRLNLEQMVRHIFPITYWWQRNMRALSGMKAADILAWVNKEGSGEEHSNCVWMLQLLGTLVHARSRPRPRGARAKTSLSEIPPPEAWAEQVAELLTPIAKGRDGDYGLVWGVYMNRDAAVSCWDSMKTTKADAAIRLFDLRANRLTWAVLDTGIDATHPAFRLRKADGKLASKGRKHASSISRVRRTFDFTNVREILSEGGSRRRSQELVRRITRGLPIDWSLLVDQIEIPHDSGYRGPGHPHGTHVAGILAGDWRPGEPGMEDEDEELIGVCRDLNLYDVRVLNEAGTGDEFSIIAAMQFLRHLNTMERRPAVQGVNLSLSIPHDVRNFACGRTPACDEAERLIANGVVTVAAAGNEGYSDRVHTASGVAAYNSISITDPGNAQNVITVGATHRREPHTYGVSFFSSRGPTGDGRKKPDLVAPGEKIYAPVPGELYERKDGTSMAAPHVSGAAALLMSRHEELVGEPMRIKQILTSTATDLGREHDFQGAGLLDICRALQSI